jgi:hypothetical protein
MRIESCGYKLSKRWGNILFDPKRLCAIRHLPKFLADWRKYSSIEGAERLQLKYSYPCLTDKTKYTSFDPHYFYQAAWLSRKLSDSSITKHVDFGSSINMISVMSAFVPTIFVDYRPLKVSLKGISSVAGDLLALPFSDRALNSISCLHVIEHVGLGRYGDTLNPKGTQLAAREIMRVLSTKGTLYLSLPVGHQRTEFNAHRIFTPIEIVSMFNGMRINDFGLIDDDGNYHASVDISKVEICDYGCGLFEMKKI